MGRQITDHETRYFWAPEGRHVHAAWRTSGSARCLPVGPPLWMQAGPAAVVPPGQDYLQVDKDVCRKCLPLADAHPELVL